MTQDEVKPGTRGRGRRPFDEVRNDVVDAAAQVLLSESYSGFTIQKVIELSGVSPATVYRHWKSRGMLALDGYNVLAEDSMPLESTGDIERDLTRIMVAFARSVVSSRTGKILTQLIVASHEDELLGEQFDDHAFGPRRRAALSLLRDAQRRGQLRADVDPELSVDLIWGPCYFRLLLPNVTSELTEEFAVSVVQTVLRSILAPPAEDV